MRKVRSGGVCLGFSLLFACGGTPATPAGEATKAQDPVKSIAEPAPGAVQPPPAVVADGKQAPAPAPSQATSFSLVAGRYGDLNIADLGSEFVVAGAGVMAHLGADGALELMPDMQQGLLDPDNKEGLELVTMAGHWPDTVWLSADTRDEIPTSNFLMYYRKGDRWQRKVTRVGLLDWYYSGYAPYSNGQMLAMRQHRVMSSIYEKYEAGLPDSLSNKVDAAEDANPPRLDVLVGGEMTPSSMKLAAGLPISFTALPTGEVFVLLLLRGSPVGGGSSSFAVQRITPGDDVGVVDSLTELSDQSLNLYGSTLVARSANEVYVAGGVASQPKETGLIARFDGKAWAEIPAPPELGVRWLAFGADGAMWAVANRSPPEGSETTALWRRIGEGPWTEVVLPPVQTPALAEPRWVFHVETDDWNLVPADPVAAAKTMKVEPREVHVRGDEVWVLAGLPDVFENETMRQVVLRSKPVPRVLELPDAAFIAAQPRTSTSKPYDPKKGCASGPAWVPVAMLAPGAAADAATPIARAFLASLSPALKEQFTTLREVEARGRRVLALTFHHDADNNREALLAAVQRFKPVEEHKVECLNPLPLRSFYEAEG